MKLRTKCDIIFAGVGGQGVLSLSSIIGMSAMREGLEVKQTEVHGMAQRGGAVVAHLRIADRPIASNLIASGGADLIIGMEPVEALRCLPYLSTRGTLVTSSNPFINIPDYPDLDPLLKRIMSLPEAIVVDCARVARKAGSLHATNMVLVGAAAHLLPVRSDAIERAVAEFFSRKGQRVIDTSVRAFRLGGEAAIRTSTQTSSA